MKNLYKHLLIVLLYTCPWFLQGQVTLTVNQPATNNTTCNRGATNFLLGDIVIRETAKADIAPSGTNRSITLELPEGFKVTPATTPTITLSASTDLESSPASINADRNELTISFKTKALTAPATGEDYIDVITISNIRVDIDVVPSGDHTYEIIDLDNFTGVTTALAEDDERTFISFPTHISGGGQCTPCPQNCTNPPFCTQGCDPPPCDCIANPSDPCCPTYDPCLDCINNPFLACCGGGGGGPIPFINKLFKEFTKNLSATEKKIAKVSKPLWDFINPSTTATERISGNPLPTVVGVCPSDVCITINTNYPLAGNFNGAFRYRAGHKAVTLQAQPSGTSVSVSSQFVTGLPSGNTVHYDVTNYLGTFSGPQQTEAWQDGDYIQINLTGSGCGALELIRVSIPPQSPATLEAEDAANLGTKIPVNLSSTPATAQEIQLGNFGNTTFEYTQTNSPPTVPSVLVPVGQYSMAMFSSFSISGGKWTFNPAGLNLDTPYLVALVDNRGGCSSGVKYFIIRLFDNSPKQLIGITNGGVCRDVASNVKIGWIGQGQIGYLACIREVGTSYGFITGGLRPEYITERGTNSGFEISQQKILDNPTVNFFEVDIDFYVCNNQPALGAIDCSLPSNPDCIRKRVRERIVISSILNPAIGVLGSTTGLKPIYCENAPSITLIGDDPLNNGTGTTREFRLLNMTQPSRSRNLIGSNPVLYFGAGTGATWVNTLSPDTLYQVQLTYGNQYGCKRTISSNNIEVSRLPQPISVATGFRFKYCVNPTTPPVFIPPLIIPNNGMNDYSTVRINWYSGGGTLLTSTPVDNSIGYASGLTSEIEKIYDFQVALVNANDCEGPKIPISVLVSKSPIVNFIATESCENPLGGTLISFDNQTTISDLEIPTDKESSWNFGDGTPDITQVGIDDITHTYSQPGTYIVTLTIRNVGSNVCSITKSKTVIVHKEAVLLNGIYVENFEDNNITWTSSSDTELLNGISKNSTWRVMPITRADGSTGKAFVTSNTNNTYNNSEYSWIESPCFDLTKLNAPLLNINLRYDTDAKSDGAFVMYTTDNGATWIKLGTGAIGKEGAEWYNDQNIIGFPAIANPIAPNPSLGYPTTLDNQRKGWSGKSKDFVEAKISLQPIKDIIGNDNSKRVRFRIVFASNSDNPVGATFSGVAIDRVVILDKNHKVFLEHFTNTIEAKYQDNNWKIFTSGVIPDDVIAVQYHTTFPVGDALGQASRPESNARSLFYAVPQPPYTVVDGKNEAGKMFYANWGTDAIDYYEQRSLEAAKFVIPKADITFTGGTGGQPLQISANILRTNAPSDKTNAVVAHMMIVENNINGNRNVVRRMLPSPGGTRLENMWANGASHTLQGTWKPGTAILANTHSVVVFIADELTKEIYQAEIFPISQNVDVSTGGKVATISPEEINLYPNPTSADVTVVLPEAPKGKVTWRMFDALGREVEGGSGTTDNALFRVTTQNCNKGIYIIEITSSEWQVRKSVSVIK